MELITTSANSAMTTTGTYWPYMPLTDDWRWPSAYYLHSSVSYDRGERAFKIAQSLMEKKVVEARTAKQFIDLMQAILENL